jgi:hypothetical protein
MMSLDCKQLKEFENKESTVELIIEARTDLSLEAPQYSKGIIKIQKIKNASELETVVTTTRKTQPSL